MRFAWTMVLVAAIAALAQGCKEEKAPPPAPAAPPPAQPAAPAAPAAQAPAVPDTVTGIRKNLADAGIAVTDVKQLPGQTMPTNCEEEWRYRFYFGERDFVNVNRFGSPTAAQACFNEYKQAVSKGGQAALDRLMPLSSVDGQYLFQFSEAMTDPKRREAILTSVKQGTAQPAQQPGMAPPAQPGAAPQPPAGGAQTK